MIGGWKRSKFRFAVMWLSFVLTFCYTESDLLCALFSLGNSVHWEGSGAKLTEICRQTERCRKGGTAGVMTSCCHSNRTKHQARERTLFSYITIPQCVLLIHVIVTVNLYCMVFFSRTNQISLLRYWILKYLCI